MKGLISFSLSAIEASSDAAFPSLSAIAAPSDAAWEPEEFGEYYSMPLSLWAAAADSSGGDSSYSVSGIHGFNLLFDYILICSQMHLNWSLSIYCQVGNADICISH
ncbi:MAG: hypothetical protein LBU32_13725 [Clostridiales bacterium]|nr:hypothetical protein [Clostridiales bacterium]